MNLPIGLWRKAALFSFSFIFIYVGIDHFLNPKFYLSIMPPILPFHLAAVLLSGFFEIIGGIGILIPSLRKKAAWGLAALIVAVYPANIYLAQTNGAAMNTSALVAWGRLPFQFLFIGIAYWHTK